MLLKKIAALPGLSVIWPIYICFLNKTDVKLILFYERFCITVDDLRNPSTSQM